MMGYSWIVSFLIEAVMIAGCSLEHCYVPFPFFVSYYVLKVRVLADVYHYDLHLLPFGTVSCPRPES